MVLILRHYFNTADTAVRISRAANFDKGTQLWCKNWANIPFIQNVATALRLVIMC